MKLLCNLELKRAGLVSDMDRNTSLQKAKAVYSRLSDQSNNDEDSEPILRTKEETGAQLAVLKKQEDDLRSKLPRYMRHLIGGYELRCYSFEIFECIRT